jgi:hypothetical protein
MIILFKKSLVVGCRPSASIGRSEVIEVIEGDQEDHEFNSRFLGVG